MAVIYLLAFLGFCFLCYLGSVEADPPVPPEVAEQRRLWAEEAAARHRNRGG